MIIKDQNYVSKTVMPFRRLKIVDKIFFFLLNIIGYLDIFT